MLPSRRHSSLLALLLLPLFGGCEAPEPVPGSQDGAPGTTTVVVLGTTDVHGWLLPFDPMAAASAAEGETPPPVDRGLSLLLPLVDSIREANPGRVVLVDSGDLLQGHPMAAAYTPLPPGEAHPVITAMNLLEYDAAALGNHEFNFGIEHLEDVLAHARFPFLAANVVEADSGEPRWPTHHLVELELDGTPLRVGITGVLPPGVAVWDRDHVEGRLHFPPILDRLREVVPRMQDEGADLLIVAAHSGFEGSSYDLEATGLGPENQMAEVARELPGIHGIFLGHSHREVADSVLHGVRFAQAGAHARSLAVMTFHLARGEAGWEVVSSEGQLLRPDPARSDPRMEEALAPARERTLALVSRPLATAPEPFPAGEARVRDTRLLRWISDVQRQVTGAELSAVAAFNLEADLPAGEITVAHLARIYPYDNNLLRSVEIRGEELRAYLEHSARYFLPCPDARCDRLVNPEWPGYNFDVIHGVSYTLDLTRPVGERVVRLERNGVPVADGDLFTLALNNYRQSGGGGFPAVASAPVGYAGTESIRDLLARDLERRGTPPPLADFEPGWELVPESLREQALREMSRGGR
jgi:2',3'-cyclic-nucleotide 2'-phosphodiesterase (5'-nucleotidase family)